jgi:Flp pilus assembly CpaE family ATPase
MVRISTPDSRTPRAKIVGVAAAHSAGGCTTLAINIASELSISGKRTLLIDAHASAPSIAILLGEQGLQNAKGFQQLRAGFWGLEVTQENISESLTLFDAALYEFDFIVVDLGPIYDLAQVLSGRRWSGETLIWIASNADQLWILSKSDRPAIERLRKLVHDLSRNSMKPSITFIQAFAKSARRTTPGDDAFLTTVTSLKPKALLRYPLDSRSVIAAETSQETLFESNEKSFLRKSIQGLLGEISA